MFNNIPTVTKNILLINIVVYLLCLVTAQQGNLTIFNSLSAHYINTPLFGPYQIITHMFTHSLDNIFHIFFNMFLLVSFGSHLERIWGAKRYFIFYIACGIGAYLLYNAIGAYQFAQIKQELIMDGYEIAKVNEYFWGTNIAELTLKSADSQALLTNYYKLGISSMVGASGALFGLLAAFGVLFPNTPLMIMFIPVPIKAKFLIGGYLLYEVYNSIKMPADNIAHLAHVGGAIVGIALVLIWRKTDRRHFY